MNTKQENEIYEWIHDTAKQMKDGLITRREAEKKIAELLKRLNQIDKQ